MSGERRIESVRSALVGSEAWLVGGSVRDRLLGRDLADIDVVVTGDVERSARLIAESIGAAIFPLSEEFGAWRVVPREGGWQVDVSPLADEGLEADLGRRDFTINAMAEPLGGGEVVDLHRGMDDLGKRLVRAVGNESFSSDPLRVARLARIACQLGFEVDGETRELSKRSAGGLESVAGERILSEFTGVLRTDDPVSGLRLMKDCGALAGAIPELLDLDGLEQSKYHHLDVWEHTLAVLEAVRGLESDPSPLGAAGERAGELMAQPLADGMTRAEGLRFAAVFHDIAKPRTKVIWEGGRVGFPGHDEIGAAMAVELVDRLRGSGRLRERTAAMVRHHLAAGFMTHDLPLQPRAIHSYLRRCGDVSVDVTILSVADRLATRGRKSDEAIARHLGVTDQLLQASVDWEIEGPPQPLLRGDQLAESLGIDPGPVLGDLLAELEAAAWAGEISTADEALDHARVHLARSEG